MTLSIIAEYVLSNLMDKHKDKLPDRIVDLMMADDSFPTLLQKKILPNSLEALHDSPVLLHQDEEFIEQVIAPALAYVIQKSVLSGALCGAICL